MSPAGETREGHTGADMPENTKRFWVGLLLLGVAGIVRAGVDVGFDAQADFAAFKTYAWKEGGWQAPNLTTEKRIHMAVEQQLEAKGLKKVEGEADLLVITYASSTMDEVVDAPSFAGLPNTWTGWSAATTSRSSFSGSLRVNLIDRETGQLVWNGRAYANLGINPNPEKTGKKVQKVVEQMFKDYPPSKAK